MQVNDFDIRAFHAVRAARMEKTIGARMARAYAVKNGVLQLFILARLLERGSI